MTRLDYIQSKILTSKRLQAKLQVWALKGKKIVFTNGCFDILHQGHVDYLSKAADLGDVLLVAVNSDHSVKRLGKGTARPIQNEGSRALLIAALGFVDAVMVFDEDTPYELIKAIQPHVLVKGADWKPENIVGYDIVTAKGGEVKTINYLEGFSTTAIEQKIKSA
jgi:D-glycero-beta-D-manno-heptose 1-phosphate adenylyltransferase